MHLEKILIEKDDLQLMVNYSGVKEGKIDKDNFRLHIYAMNPSSGKPLFSSALNLLQVRELYSHLESFELVKNHGLSSTAHIVEVDDNSLKELLGKVTSIGTGILNIFLSKLSREKKVDEILGALSYIELVNLTASFKQQSYKDELKKLSLILHLEDIGNLCKVSQFLPYISEYKAGQPEKILQNWIEKNLWVFGVEYEKLEGFRKISESSEGDLVMQSIDGYLDLIELKRSKYNLLNFDSSHHCYYGSSELNKVIGQSIHYIKSLQEYSKTLIDEEDVKILRPRVKIIAGRSVGFNSQQFDTLRGINSHLVDINIITYDEVLRYGYKIISHYE